MTRNKYETKARAVLGKKKTGEDLCGRQEMKRGRMSEMEKWQTTEVSEHEGKDDLIKMEELISLRNQGMSTGGDR